MPPDRKKEFRTMNPPPSSGDPSGRKRDIRDTEGYKASTKGVKRFWTNYQNILKTSFNDMSRDEQEDLIDKFAMIVTIGVSVLVILIFYPMVPRPLRVLGLPVALLVAWWAGRKVVGPVIVARLEGILKREDRED